MGTYRAELVGNDGSYGDLYQDVTVVDGTEYKVSGLYFNILYDDPDVMSQSRVLVGTPADPEAYTVIDSLTGFNIWSEIIPATFIAVGTTVRITLQSRYTGTSGGIVPTLFTGFTLAPTEDTGFVVLPYEGRYRASLLGGLATDGKAQTVAVTIPGTEYTYAIALYIRRNSTDVGDFSTVHGLIGTASDRDAFTIFANEHDNVWELHTGRFVATEVATWITVWSQYSDTAYPVYIDAADIHLGGLDGELETPVLDSNIGENPVDLITYILNRFDPTARMDLASFSAARLSTEANNLLMVGRITAPTDSFTLASRVARQSGMLLQKNRNAAYMLTMLDDSRPISFVFDIMNMLENVVVSSTPNDSWYTSVFVYFDTKKGGSTDIGDYEAVAFLTADETNAVGGDIETLQILCSEAREALGKERRLEYFADLIHDPATAFHFLAFLVTRYVTAYATIQWQTWLDAMPLRLGDLVTVEHLLLPVPFGSSPVEILNIAVEPTTMLITFTGRTPTVPFELEAPPPVTHYVQFHGSVTSQLLVSDAQNMLSAAKSLTVVAVLSHVTTEGSLFLLRQELGAGEDRVDAVRVYINPAEDYIELRMGSGASSYEPLYSSSFGWSCSYSDSSSPQLIKTLTGVIDQSKLGIYIITFDWANRALYMSGVLSGLTIFESDIQYDNLDFVYTTLQYTACHPGANVLIEPSVSTEGKGFYVGANIGSAFSPVIGTEGFIGRMYELGFFTSRRRNTIEEIITLLHAPLLSYLTALYTPDVEVRDTVGIPRDYLQAWYRDNYTLSGSLVADWKNWRTQHPDVVPISNPPATLSLSGAPSLVDAEGIMPEMNFDVTLASLIEEV